MKAPRGGLRPLHNRRHSVAKVELRVPAGGVVEVQDDVAAQLLATGDFAEGAPPSATLAAIDRNHERRYPADAEPAPVVDVAPDDVAPKPTKRAARS
jgi:hypothetical protein